MAVEALSAEAFAVNEDASAAPLNACVLSAAAAAPDTPRAKGAQRPAIIVINRGFEFVVIQYLLFETGRTDQYIFDPHPPLSGNATVINNILMIFFGQNKAHPNGMPPYASSLATDYQ